LPVTNRIKEDECIKNIGLSLFSQKGKIDSKYRLYDGEDEQVGRMKVCKNILLVVKDNIRRPTQVRTRGKMWDEKKDKKGRQEREGEIKFTT
jgi:hypothetical protein